MTKQRVHMPKKEFLALKNKLYEVDEQLILEVAGYKLYYMLNNAYNRTKRRSEYKYVKYKLGAYRDGMTNLKRYRPDLYDKFLKMINTYLEHGMNGDYAPTIHRTQQHYEWETIDILTVKEHKDLDNAKPTIVRSHFVLEKSVPGGALIESLTLELIKEVAKGKQFPSITKAIEYLQNEYGVKPSKAKNLVDTAETLKIEKGSFEILKVESIEQVRKIKVEKFQEMFVEKFPRLHETINAFKETISTPTGQKAFSLSLKLSKLKHIGYKLKKDGYENLKVKLSF